MSLDFLNKLASDSPGSILSMVKAGNRKSYLEYSDQVASEGQQPMPYGDFIRQLPTLAEKVKKADKKAAKEPVQ